MTNIMKSFFRSSIVTSILLAILGGLLIFESEATIIAISYIIGGVLIALGVVALIRYVKNMREAYASELDIVYGFVTIILGSLIIGNPKALASVIPIVLGISIVISSATKLQYAFELKKEENSLWTMTMIVALLSTLCGVVLIFNPFKGAQMITQIIGGFIVAYAILDIISTITIKRNVTMIQKSIKKSVKEAKVVEEEDEK